MRFTDILSETILNELKMSPGFLQKLANSVEGAQAGMEFEMCVPDVSAEDPDDFYPEPNYDEDGRPRSIDHACQFFHDGDYNSRRDIERLKDKLTDEYQEWLTSKIAEQWDSGDGLEACLKYCTDDEGLEGEEAEAAAQEMMDDRSGRTYDRLWDDYFSYYQDDFSDSDWIDDEYDNLSDISDRHDIQWPYYTEFDSSNSDGIGEVADEFHAMIGRGVNWSDDYHGAKRQAGKYCLEPDGSVESDDGDKMGLEFISPALPLKEMISDLEKVVKWANEKGCETNESTGLHMNVSIPNFNSENFDYIKFAIFLGDEYILQQFGRTGNTYAKSAISKIKQKAEQRPGQVVNAFNLLKSHLQQIATHAIHDGQTDKYTSINMKTGYAEIRSPGGDWLNEDIGKLTATLNRIVVAFDAACSPEKYAKEYATKLYKLLSAQGDDSLGLFLKYSSGAITAEELKTQWASKVVNNPETRKSSKNTLPLANKIIRGPEMEQIWYVSPDGQVGKEMQIRAKNENEAMLKAIEMRPDIYGNLTPADIRVGKTSATLLRQQAPQGQWGRWFVDFADHTQAAVSARSREEAENAGYQLGRGRIINVTAEDPNHREQLPVIKRWIVKFTDGAEMTVDARDHHSAEQEVIRQTNYSQNEIDSIVLVTQ